MEENKNIKKEINEKASEGTLISQIFSQIDEVESNGEEIDSLDLFGYILSQPDEILEKISPIFLESFENTFNSPAFLFSAKEMILEQGADIHTIIDVLDEELDNIEEELSDKLTPMKRDFLYQILSLYVNALSNATHGNKFFKVPFEFCSEDAKLPQYAHPTDSGADVYATKDFTIRPGETIVVPTGLKCQIPNGYEIQIRPKSGISAKTKLRVANAPATIDEGYKDELGIIIDNIEPPIKQMEIDYDDNGKMIVKSIEFGRDYYIEKGQKIAQLVLSEVPKMIPYQISKISTKEDRGGGFGSTGLK